MTKILWHSNAPDVPTGYGQQTDLFTRRFRDAGHDVAISANYGHEGAIRIVDGFVTYPTDITRWGKHALKLYAKDHGQGDLADVQVITLMDVWTWVDLRAQFGGMVADFDGLRLAAWVPIDHDPIPVRVCAALDHFKATPIAMSRFGEQQLKNNGFDPLYVPHGIDTNIFRPQDDREKLKVAMGLKADAFVVGMVANNNSCMPPRKSFPQVFQAFAQFHQQHPEAVLYLHTEILGMHDGVNLFELAEINGIPSEAIAHVPQDKYLLGTITPEAMARVYSIMDVLANPSHGEGFGIPIVEAQACGVPVIVTDWTAMPELCGAGWKVTGDRWFNRPQSSFFMCPSVYEIVDALEKAWEARGDGELRARAREFALQYDADRVMETYWKPALERLDPPREVGPLVPNREMRRRAARKKVVAA